MISNSILAIRRPSTFSTALIKMGAAQSLLTSLSMELLDHYLNKERGSLKRLSITLTKMAANGLK
jgi:hypothetical protein